MPTFGSRVIVKRSVFGYNETDEEEINNVENANAPDDLPRGFGDFFPRVFGLGSSQPRKFGSAKGKRGCDKDGTESMEAIEESTIWRMPNTSPFGQCVSGTLSKHIHTSIWHRCNLCDRLVHHHSL
jgi:hypothetical protein